ncbi:MAG TPA: HNH endonuclease [Gordonia sp. (in: high G+C Gram-positive bacteria)]|uniref:HNH endonuclease n=1 Tax=unclassified Gordonia (in: high G+C Gram-positive bacteria) TaxID=2657482 RepID=UPI000F93B697|nr:MULTISPECIES: HNH endonuclease [unclassified Gordonia (in: high G+C Gram-positive bacteria)]RUP39971.1 MAG: endonuclease [Gordonia sp. (in: high G+C Gram-positive bacteria)]HNP56535.1 HNH endonuclease [Gordonia sp. (in: high G+C Gram-positive bacteria)]HRC49624.1 HNH endonuclease [Gordonia sp. (in: high G+C Gram-positive bacteria)]
MEKNSCQCCGGKSIHPHQKKFCSNICQQENGRRGITNEWKGSELAFVLDHIDGDSSNNRPENLRLVCPNCDSQLPTYKSRNRGSGRAWRRQRYADGRSY